MAIHPGYFLKETTSNLWRNIALTIAAVFTVAITLVMVGTAYMVSLGASRATAQFKDGVEFIVYVNADAAADQDAAIREAIDGSPEVKSWTYVDQQASYAEFRELFADEPELLENIQAEDLPPSYRVIPENADANAVEDLAQRFEGRPGVRKVATASDVIRFIEDFGDRVTFMFGLAAVVLVIASVLLILNTVFTAIGARRREIEVMKLVGATNWFIRIPFMLEGLVHGLLGGAIAIPILFYIDKQVFQFFQESEDVALFKQFAVTTGEIWQVGFGVLAIGAIVGVIGSAFAVTRYLDV